MVRKTTNKYRKVGTPKVKTTKYEMKECSVSVHLRRLNLNDAGYRAALFKWHNIREVYVKLDRNDAVPQNKKTIKSTMKAVSARSHVAWLPTVASTLPNTTSAFSALANHQTVEKPSMEEFFTELKSKWHNLKPESERPRPAEQPKEDPKWIQIYNHFQRQKKLRKSNQN